MKRHFPRIFRYLYSPPDSSTERGDLRSRHGSKGSLVARGSARSLTINLGFGCCFAAATLTAIGGAHAQPTDDSLRIYAVDIWQR
jgi:hypothetical protein